MTVRFESAKRKIYLTKNEHQLATFKCKHEGERCFIIDNGPSLRINDLDKLKNEITFAANKIYLAFKQAEWRPTYYAVTDRLVAIQNHHEINRLNGFVKFFPCFAKTRKWNTPFDESIYFRYVTNRYPEPPGFEINVLDKVFAGRTVIYALIQIACFMGIKKIYLIGIDFNFTEPSEKNGDICISEGEVNHFHPDYRKLGEEWAEPKLDYQLMAFQTAKNVVEPLGINIYNATIGGNLELFERVKYESLFG